VRKGTAFAVRTQMACTVRCSDCSCTIFLSAQSHRLQPRRARIDLECGGLAAALAIDPKEECSVIAVMYGDDVLAVLQLESGSKLPHSKKCDKPTNERHEPEK
jgi:hypothetical protein